MADIGSLIAHLGVDSATFNRDLKTAARNVNSFSSKSNQVLAKMERKWQSLTKSIFSMRGAMVAVGSATAMGYFIKRSLDTADAIAKVADKIGVTTDELQEYRYAADLAGVSQKQLDMGLQRFSRRIAEVAAGTGELKKVAEQYDVQLRDSNGQMRRNSEILADFADIIKNAESEQEQLRIAFKLFDSEGAALVNMLKNGGDAMNKMRREARNLGIVIDENLIRNSEKAKDRLTTVSHIIRSQLTKAVLNLSPKIVELGNTVIANSDKIREFAEDLLTVGTAAAKAIAGIAGLTSEIGRGLGIAVARAMGHLDDEWERHEKRIKEIRAELSQLEPLPGIAGGMQGGEVVKRRRALLAELKNEEESLKALAEEINELNKEQNREIKVNVDLKASGFNIDTKSTDEIEEQNKKLKERQQIIEQARKEEMDRLSDILDAETEYIEQGQEAAEAVAGIKGEVEAMWTAWCGADMKKAEAAYEEYLKKNLERTKTWNQGVLDALNKQAAKATTTYDMMFAVTEEFAESSKLIMSTVLFDGIRGELEDFGDYFDLFLDRMVNTWARTVSDMAVEWAANLGKNALSSVLDRSGGAGGLIKGVVGGIASLFHEGGIVGAGGRAIPLKGNEYIGVLQRGEVVLSQDMLRGISTSDLPQFLKYLTAGGMPGVIGLPSEAMSAAQKGEIAKGIAGLMFGFAFAPSLIGVAKGIIGLADAAAAIGGFGHEAAAGFGTGPGYQYGGIVPRDQVALVHRGEGVFTPEQMKHLMNADEIGSAVGRHVGRVPVHVEVVLDGDKIYSRVYEATRDNRAQIHRRGVRGYVETAGIDI